MLRCIGSKGLSYGGFRFEGNHQNCNIINCTIYQGFLATTYCSTTVTGYIFKNSGNIICGKFFADDNSCSITIKNSVFYRPVIDGTVTSTKQNCTIIPNVGYPNMLYGLEHCPQMISKPIHWGLRNSTLFILFVI